jgi:hypothetical protein
MAPVAHMRCFSPAISSTIGTAMLALIWILASGPARAGVVIEQRVSIGNGATPSSVRNRTLMLQDDKEKFQIVNGMTVVIDANDRTVLFLDDKHKVFSELPLRRLIGTSLDPNRDVYQAFKSSNRSRELLGFKCQDYTGERNSGPLITATTACFSTNATGAHDFDHFIKTIVRHSGRLEGASIPAGLPLAIESKHGVNTSFVPPNVSKQEAQRFQRQIAHIPTQITRVDVTKITSVELSTDTFTAPAGYVRRGPRPD